LGRILTREPVEVKEIPIGGSVRDEDGLGLENRRIKRDERP